MNERLLLLVAYSGLLVGLGIWVGRRVASAGAFFVAGRGLGPGLLFATVLAANIGAGSTVGAAGLGYRDGLAAWWWVGSAGVGTVLLACWIGPRMRAVAARQQLLTVGDFLEWRYGSPVRFVATALLWVATLTILAAQLVAVAFVLQAVAGIPPTWGCLLAGAVMTAYFTAGGLVTSAWVNLVQLVVLGAGFAAALPLAWAAAGGWPALASAGAAGIGAGAAAAAGGATALGAGVGGGAGSAAGYANWWQNGPSGWNYLALLVPAFMVSPGLLQKVYGGRDDRAVRAGVGLSALALLVFAVVPPLLGMAARVLHPELPARELALPVLLASELPLWVGTLGLAAVFSAEISSADAILFMLATSLSEDLYRRFLRPGAADAAVLRVARAGSVAGGALGTLLAILFGSVIESMTVFYSLLGVILFVPVVAGLHGRETGQPGAGDGVAAMAAIVAGVAGFLAGRWLLALPATAALNPNLFGLLCSAAAFLLTGTARRCLRRGAPVA